MNLKQKVEGTLTREAAKQASSIRAALKISLNIDALVADWEHQNFTTMSRADARDWARIHAKPVNQKALRDAIRNIIAFGYAMGEDVGKAYYAKAKTGASITKAAPNAKDINDWLHLWDTWTPGYQPAALLVKPRGSLSKLLEDSGVTITSIQTTSLNRLGTILGDALAKGWAGDKLANEIEGLLTDPSRALMIANTEMARAMSTATMDTYRGFGVEKVEWLHADLCNCDLCNNAEDMGPQDIGFDWSEGDDVTEPPMHPNCICTIAPVIDDGESDFVDVADSIDLAAKPDTLEPMTEKAGVPGPAEVLRAQSRLAILPNPNHPDLDKPEKYVESPWPVDEVPVIDPNVWDDAQVVVVNLHDLQGTDPWLKRKNVAKHIEAMGQAITPFRSYALVAEVNGSMIIIDGHHRLMAAWLLGQETAPVWKVEI